MECAGDDSHLTGGDIESMSFLNAYHKKTDTIVLIESMMGLLVSSRLSSLSHLEEMMECVKSCLVTFNSTADLVTSD